MTPVDDPRPGVRALLARHGWNATSFQVFEPGFRYWFDDDACVAYVDTGAAWVAAGAPIAARERLDEVARRFVAAARAAGRRASFFASEQRFVDATGLPSLRIGEQPVWAPREWDATLATSRSLREQLRRARAKGVAVRAVGPDEIVDPESTVRRAIERLARRWLGSRAMAPMGFLVQLHLSTFLEERRFFVAERAGEMVAFLAVVPIYAREGWFLEDLVRDPTAPNGTPELLVDAAMRAAAAEGRAHVTLGLAPLSGAVNRWLRFARRAGAGLYDFAGVRAFKEKLRPRDWEPVYLTFPVDGNAAIATWDALAAFARGGLLAFGLESLSRGPAIVMRLLAALLVPWTVALALVPAREFPSPCVRWAWVAFDVALVAALFALTRRWRRPLATIVLGALLADVAVTVTEALAWNAQHSRSAVEWVLLLLAVLAPALATWLVWRARAHRSRLDEAQAIN